MAPQIGIGTFRIQQSGNDVGFAMSNGVDVEIWALLDPGWDKPTFPGPTVMIEVVPIMAAPDPVNMSNFCAFLTSQGVDPAAYEIRYHSISIQTCGDPTKGA